MDPDFLNECNYFLIFYENTDKKDIITVYHLVGYINKPSKQNIEYNRKEMIDDPDFGIGKKAENLRTAIVNPEMANRIMNQYGKIKTKPIGE